MKQLVSQMVLGLTSEFEKTERKKQFGDAIEENSIPIIFLSANRCG